MKMMVFSNGLTTCLDIARGRLKYERIDEIKMRFAPDLKAVFEQKTHLFFERY